MRNFFKNTNIMNVSINAQSRVLFGVEGTYFASVDSLGITTDMIEYVNGFEMGFKNYNPVNSAYSIAGVYHF